MWKEFFIVIILITLYFRDEAILMTIDILKYNMYLLKKNQVKVKYMSV